MLMIRTGLRRRRVSAKLLSYLEAPAVGGAGTPEAPKAFDDNSLGDLLRVIRGSVAALAATAQSGAGGADAVGEHVFVLTPADCQGSEAARRGWAERIIASQVRYIYTRAHLHLTTCTYIRTSSSLQ